MEDITRDQVLVTPAPGETGKLPFWHGDALGRPVEVGQAVGAFLREVADHPDPARLAERYGLDDWAAANLVQYVREQADATGTVPSDRTVVLERFRDEIGDWRMAVHSPLGARVHAPWALAIEARARERLGLEVQTMVSDDGIVVRLPEADEAPPLDLVIADPEEVEDLVVAELQGSALFASRFRECAARALLLPRRRPGGRTPLWQQRQKAADLLQVAGRYGGFPILLETYRECLRDVFDLPGLQELLRRVAQRLVRVVEVETPAASPFASSLLFDYMAGYMYEGDAPLAERRASALTLDRELLADLLGTDELRELVDPDALDQLELELQRLADERKARDADEVADLLRALGDLRPDEVAARTDGPADLWLDELATARRVCLVRVAGEERWVAAEDAARYRDGLGIPPPPGLPDTYLEPVDRPLVDLVARYARTHGPFTTPDVAARLGLPPDSVALALKELEREQRVTRGAFRPPGRDYRSGLSAQHGGEWCHTEVLRRLRRRSLAVLRREVEPVDGTALTRFLVGWQGVGAQTPGADRLLEVVEQLQGAPVPASVLERDMLAARVRDYTPAWLDELCASGEVVWIGRGPLGARDGRVALYLRDQVAALAQPPGDPPTEAEWWGEPHERMLAHLTDRGASFWDGLYTAAGGGQPQEVADALWDLVWAGLVTNDTVTPLRALVGAATPRRRGPSRRAPRGPARGGPPATAGRWSLVAELRPGAAEATERMAALAAQLLDRHGVVTRDAVAAEDVEGGYGAVYPVLKAMEEAGRARRGYFVEHLGGAQFAFPGAVDRLRAVRERDADEGRTTALAAVDPANPYGAALPWPPTPGGRGGARRVAGAYVVLVDGELAAYLERGGRSVLTYTDEQDVLAQVASGLAWLVDAGRVRQLQMQRVDAAEVADQPLVDHLRGCGFADHPRGLIRRPA